MIDVTERSLPLYRRGKTMTRGPCTFRKRDVVRLIHAAKAAGMLPKRIWVEVGKDGSRLVLGFASGQDHEVEHEIKEEAAKVDTWEDVA